jgi:hypothetical protein
MRRYASNLAKLNKALKLTRFWQTAFKLPPLVLSLVIPLPVAVVALFSLSISITSPSKKF